MTKITIPSWARKESRCPHCLSFNDASKIEITEFLGEQVVRVEYECLNPDCLYKKLFNRNRKPARLYSGPYVEKYRESLARSNKAISDNITAQAEEIRNSLV